jgi:hypothetical protein
MPGRPRGISLAGIMMRCFRPIGPFIIGRNSTHKGNALTYFR